MLAEAKSQMSSSGEIRAKLTALYTLRAKQGSGQKGKGEEHGKRELKKFL